MAQILAIDYGKVRTGLAVTDDLQIIASGLTTVPTKELIDFLKDYIKKNDVELFLVGDAPGGGGAKFHASIVLMGHSKVKCFGIALCLCLFLLYLID